MKKNNYVKRAIIMAAGEGKRLRPFTNSNPKPLIKVNGIRMIDTVIDALLLNDICEIYIVVGYLKEQFSVIKEKYSQIQLIENPYYLTCNNISSLYAAREYLEDCMILDGDQIINNYKVLDPCFEKSGYNAIWVEGYTDEWLMQVHEGKVVSCSRNGGVRGWQLFSVSRWDKEAGAKLKENLVEEFEIKKNRQIYWDDIPMFEHADEYDLGIYEMQDGDVVEIDSVDELVNADASYLNKWRSLY